MSFTTTIEDIKENFIRRHMYVIGTRFALPAKRHLYKTKTSLKQRLLIS